MVVWPNAGLHWDYSFSTPRSLVKIDTTFINKKTFDAWLASKKVLIDKSWMENQWAIYRVYSSTLSQSSMASKWGVVAAPPPPAPPTGTAVQYWNDEDKMPAEVIAHALGAKLVKTEHYETLFNKPTPSDIITVGGQEVNPVFTEIILAEPKIREITKEDEGFIFIQAGVDVDTEPPTNVWAVAGWTAVDTMDAAKYIRDNGLPADTIRIKTEEPAPPETDLHKAWREFKENPDIITGLGLLPSSIIESFSRVFTGYSYIDDKPAEPRLGDWIGVGSILAGVTTAALGGALAIMGAGTAYTVPGLAGKFTTVSSTAYAPRAMSGAALTSFEKVATASTKSEGLRIIATSEGIISTSVRGVPGSAVLLAKQLMAMPMKFKLFAVLSGGFLLTQLDATGWFFGLSPEAGHNKAAKLLGSIRSDLIRLDGLVDDKQWDEANKMVPTIRAQIEEVGRIMDAWPVKFWETFGFTMQDKETMLAAQTANFETYLNQYPQLSTMPPAFPKEFTLENVEVEDGDTLVFPRHPEVQDRIRIIGIDAHEAETAAGIEETKYLKSLIEGRWVTIKTHEFRDPERTIGRYGRLLGGVFLGDQDIALAMLEHFGTQMKNTAFWGKKYRWIDWDLYKRVAAEATGPAVKEFKILIDSVPSNAKLHIDGIYTHHLTPSNEKELKDVMHMLAPGEHVLKATKAGKEASMKVTILPGANPNFILTLKTVGLVPEEPEEVPAEAPPEIEEFRINILSTPSRAKLYIDGVYTHHLTPSNAKELSDVMHLLTPGEHTLRVTKAGKATEKKVTIIDGINEPIYLTLTVVGLPASKEDLLAQIQGYMAIIEKLQAELEKL